jgi:hypothetical protein
MPPMDVALLASSVPDLHRGANSGTAKALNGFTRAFGSTVIGWANAGREVGPEAPRSSAPRTVCSE